MQAERAAHTQSTPMDILCPSECATTLVRGANRKNPLFAGCVLHHHINACTAISHVTPPGHKHQS